MPEKTNPIRPTDDEARRLARHLLDQTRYGSLGVINTESGTPHVTRIALARLPGGEIVSLISDLAFHSRALAASPSCSILVGSVPAKGDPLAFPRITLSAVAEFLDHKAKEACRHDYLHLHPKAQIYYGFADFRIVRFTVTAADLNGGFGKAYQLTPEDLNG